MRDMVLGQEDEMMERERKKERKEGNGEIRIERLLIKPHAF